ncbi:hypothetical protein AO262_32355 [Pseudomonas fluorescens ABAC62]|nr:hypothetical protein AO262_32355 [Pseudomonas fluorescens ABAC62]
MINRMMFVNIAVLALGVGSTSQVLAVQAFGEPYTPVGAVAEHQAQVVYYRAATGAAQPGAAHVYIDREFHTGLLPGGFTAFCVAPGPHALGAYTNDAPAYRGKTTDVYTTDLKGGKTYFLKVGEGPGTAPLAVKRADAERELASTRRQVQALSRASSVQNCITVEAPTEKPYKDYALSGDVLFNFGKAGYSDISFQGRQAIQELIKQLRAEHGAVSHIEVIGHTDPIGSALGNQALGLRRAQTVQRLLRDGGLGAVNIEASSRGATEPLSSGCDGSRAEQIACYAQDRRVVVRVDTLR